jgi:uncharacterized protein
MKKTDFVALILVVVGAINWGLWGLFKFNLVGAIFGGQTFWLARLVFIVVGLAGVWACRWFGCFKKACMSGGSGSGNVEKK